MTYIQDPPFAVQVEFTEGCNFRCTFCGLNGIRRPDESKYLFMTVELADFIAASMAQAGWTARVEFAMHGEPSINPNMVELVAAFRKHLPNTPLMMTSNGAGFVNDTARKVLAMRKAGLNLLCFDDYKDATQVLRIRQNLRPYKAQGKRELAHENRLAIFDYPKDGLQNSPHRRVPVGQFTVLYIEDIQEAAKGSHAKLNNHCGAGAPRNDDGVGKRCAKPFRELSIRWDGSVAICCNDWRGVYKVGNVRPRGVEHIWLHPAFVAARKKLYYGERDFGACKGCDATSTRVGLLPDKLGKVTLPHANPDDVAAIKRATAGNTLTQIVLRPWEN
jgi:MoaA/NifB/PqqE/SkfB family radical SAM enzyme